MSDEHDHDQSPTDTHDQTEEGRGDWDPMVPETTVAETATDQAVREEERQIETGEENPT